MGIYYIGIIIGIIQRLYRDYIPLFPYSLLATSKVGI